MKNKMFICFILFLLNSENKRPQPSGMSQLKKYDWLFVAANKQYIIILFRFFLSLSLDWKLCKDFFKLNFPTLAEGSYEVCLSTAIKKLEAALVSVSSKACEMEESSVARFDTRQLAKIFLIVVMDELSQKK